MNLFFDLDGTLTDPREGIVRSLQHALVTLGYSPPDAAGLEQFIGPPLAESFRVLLSTLDEAQIQAAVAAYRGRFSERGLFENRLYPDVPSGLNSLQTAGHRLWVVTSKPEVYAQRIVAHFGLSCYFHQVYGSELSGERANKAELIRYVLEQEKLSGHDVLMIGDRKHDILGARANRMRAVGVAWGYGSLAELASANPHAIVNSMAELIEYVRGTARP
ncbi:MAG: HAD family hydrolase [Deltaproteobacteria bacterium]|nr:HAD family hydrolase [Deltaproteobacteria bacterium]